MRKQINPTIKAHLLASLFVLLSLLAIGVIPFTQAQRNSTKRLTQPNSAAHALLASGVAPMQRSSIPASGVMPVAPAAQTANPYPVPVVRYGFAQVNIGGTNYFYVFGGVSNGNRINNVRRYNLTTGAWEARAPMPFTSEAPTCALMQGVPVTSATTCKFIYCAEGDTGTGFAVYDADADTWTPLPNTPSTAGNDYGSASGAWNRKFYLVGGTTNFLPDVWVFTTTANGLGGAWATTMGPNAPNPFLLAGYTQVGQYLYVVGGWTGGVATGLTTAMRLALDTGTWTTGTQPFTMGRADFGLAYDPGKCKLYALGGDTQGGGFFDSTNEVDELDVSAGTWPATPPWAVSPPALPTPNRQANQAGFHGALCAAGTLSGGTIWSTGGIDGSTFTFLADHLHRANMCSPTAVRAVSRLTHTGGCGTFDVDLPLWCPAGVEDRQGNPSGGDVNNTYTMVVTFDEPIAALALAQASVTCHTSGGVGNVSAVATSGCTATITLTGVNNAQTLVVTLANVVGLNTGGTTASTTIPMAILIGDVNGNGSVNAADTALAKNVSGNSVNECNFRADVNHNCAINAADSVIIRAHAGSATPLCCP